MSDSEKPQVTICLPHWQVRELITVCLRAIRRFTPTASIEVIVVDNGSEDDSLDYLRGLRWIRLIERGKLTPEYWVHAFQTALDVGLEQSRGEYYVIMHTDTIIKHPGWLERLLGPARADERCAAVGAWKLERVHPAYDLMKRLTDTKRAKLWLRRRLLGDGTARQKSREICPRDYCTLYRAGPIRRYGLKFEPGEPYEGYTAGEKMYYQLRDHGYGAAVLETGEMMEYMEHVAHATAGLRPEQRHLGHRRSQRKVERRLREFFDSPLIRELAGAEDLDR